MHDACMHTFMSRGMPAQEKVEPAMNGGLSSAYAGQGAGHMGMVASALPVQRLTMLPKIPRERTAKC